MSSHNGHLYLEKKTKKTEEPVGLVGRITHTHTSSAGHNLTLWSSCNITGVYMWCAERKKKPHWLARKLRPDQCGFFCGRIDGQTQKVNLPQSAQRLSASIQQPLTFLRYHLQQPRLQARPTDQLERRVPWEECFFSWSHFISLTLLKHVFSVKFHPRSPSQLRVPCRRWLATLLI